MPYNLRQEVVHMWPTLSVGSSVSVLAKSRRRTLKAVLVGIGRDGELQLALYPSTPRRFWRPLKLDRWEVKGVWAK
jgi:hypothetical protein